MPRALSVQYSKNRYCCFSAGSAVNAETSCRRAKVVRYINRCLPAFGNSRHLTGLSLRFVDTLQTLGRDSCFAGIAKSIIDIRYSFNCCLTVKVTMAVHMNFRCKSTQLGLKLV